MNQSKLMSLVESFANVLVGFGVSMVANLIILPAFGYNVSVRDAFGIGVAFTVVSIARSYVIRRFFNGLRWRVKP